MAKRKKNTPSKGVKKVKNSIPGKGKSTSGFWTDTKKHLILIFVIAFVLYGNTLFHGFTQDDSIVIIDNEFTTKGLAGIPQILSEDTFFGFFSQQKDLVAGGRYRPLSLVTFAIEYQFFGANPFIGHFGNIVLYGLTGILLYLTIFLLLKPEGKSIGLFPHVISLGATLLFMVHPIHTEAVANIKGRDEIMSLMGSLAALYFAMRAFKEKENRYLIFSGICFFLGIMSKENAITYLAVIPLALHFFTKASFSEIAKLTLPSLGAAILFIAIRSAILGGISVGDPPMELMNNPYLKLVNNQYVPFTGSEKLSTITYTLGKYVQLLVAPLELTHDYYPKHIDLMPWSNWKVLLSLIIYLGLIALALFNFNRRRIIAFSIIYFIATLSIVSNVVFPIGTHMSERFMYMPSVGYSLIITYLFYLLGSKFSREESIKSVNNFKMPVIIFGIILILFSVKTIHRNMAWKSNYTLFLTDAKTSANSAKIQNSVGGEIIARSLEEKNAALKSLPNQNDPTQVARIDEEFMQKVASAVPHLQEAARIHPTYANPFLQLGNAHNYLKKYDEAFSYYNQALVYKNPYKEATQNMGITYKDAGQYYGEKLRDFPKAISYLNEALKYENNDTNEIKRLLALCYASSGQLDKAIGMLEDLLRSDPNNSNHHANLAAMYAQRGEVTNNPEDRQKAQQHQQRSEELKTN